jgi:hypothetical protein
MIRRIASSMVALVACASIASAQVKLEQKFVEGSQARYRITAKSHQILDIGRMKVETQSEESGTIRWTVGTRDPDGTMAVRQTLEAVRAELNLPGGLGLAFDSANPEAKDDNPALAVFRDIYRGAVGLEVTFVLDKDKRVKEVRDAEKALRKIEELNPAAADQIKTRLDPDRLKAAFTQQVNLFPPTPVRTGETWDRTEVFDLAGGQSLSFQVRYEYLGTVEQNGVTLDKIGAKAQELTYTVLDPKAEPSVTVKKNEKGQLVIALAIESSDGTVLFDRKKGAVVESRRVDHITGEMTLMVGGKELPTKLDLTLDLAATLQK